MTDFNKPTASDKIVPIVCGVILLAFIACVPSMANDKEKREAKAWHDNGCKIYDDYKAIDVPAKCSAYFVDHYKAQQARLQPPEASK